MVRAFVPFAETYKRCASGRHNAIASMAHPRYDCQAIQRWRALMLEGHDPDTDGLPLPREALPMPDTYPPAVVVVEDDPDVLSILHRLLRDLTHNHALIAVSSGQAALELLAMCPVSLLITDYNMSGMNGLQL